MLVAFTPIVRSPEHNVARIERLIDLEEEDTQFIAGGDNAGIIVRKYSPNAASIDYDMSMKFTMSVVNAITGDDHQELRVLHLRFDKTKLHADSITENESGMKFVGELMKNLTGGYGDYFAKLCKMMKHGYPEIMTVELETKSPSTPVAEEKAVVPAETGVTVDRIQDLLERAYPNGLTFETIMELLNTTDELTIEAFLLELANAGILKRTGNEWLRTEQFTLHPLTRFVTTAPEDTSAHPTIAIITGLYIEKLAVDGIIENATTVHKYKSGGESNVYTVGKIGPHTVVATKLAIVGSTVEATISAGSITTRLLGNFQHIKHVFVIGVAGGVMAERLRRGDVVISGGRIDEAKHAYNHAYQTDTGSVESGGNGIAVRHWDPKENKAAEVASKFDTDSLKNWSKETTRLVKKLNEAHPGARFSKPAEDVLAVPLPSGGIVTVDQPDSRPIPKAIIGPVGSVASLRSETAAIPLGFESELDWLAAQRQEIIDRESLRALDVGGFDPVIASIEGNRIDSWAVVLGIADYAHGNSRSAQEWKPFAAANAASLVREIILHIE
uniref:PNP_UDP_1 domain-containing protein n=1 Tax=Panagrellus redivivus TaxID=6233 RepID=A0A7E4WE92_PANRE